MSYHIQFQIDNVSSVQCNYGVINIAHMWPLVTSLRLRARAGDAKRSPTPGTQNYPHVGNYK